MRLIAAFCTQVHDRYRRKPLKIARFCGIYTGFVVVPLWIGNCIVRMQGEPAVRITIKGLLIFCSLIAGLIMAEVVAASNQNDSASPAAVGFNN